MKHVAIAIFTLFLFGCSENTATSNVQSVDGLDALLTIEDGMPSDYETVLADVRIRPHGGVLSKEEMLGIADILHQMVLLAESDGAEAIKLPASADLFLSLDASLGEAFGWSLIE